MSEKGPYRPIDHDPTAVTGLVTENRTPNEGNAQGWESSHGGQAALAGGDGPEGRSLLPDPVRKEPGAVAADRPCARPTSRFSPNQAECRELVAHANARAERLAKRIVTARHAVQRGATGARVLAILEGAEDA